MCIRDRIEPVCYLHMYTYTQTQTATQATACRSDVTAAGLCVLIAPLRYVLKTNKVMRFHMHAYVQYLIYLNLNTACIYYILSYL